jgi:hypothetical protein
MGTHFVHHCFRVLRARPVRALTALGLALALSAATCTESDQGGDGPGPRAPGQNGAGPVNSADRLLFWLACPQVAVMSDAQLDQWKERGVDGFVCVVQHLRGMGGSNEIAADVNAVPAAPEYDLQRRVRDSGVVERAKRRGMDVYFGFYLVNRNNTSTPLMEWFDEAGWSGVVIPRVNDAAAAAKQMGFAGLAFDQELYPQLDDARTATWNWDYPGNTRPQGEVRAMAKRRGQQLMATILEAFPAVDILAYATFFPDTWDEVVQQEVNGRENFYDKNVQIDFWDGLTSVEGYAAIRFLNAIFYKTPHVEGSTWDTALQYEYNSLYSLLSQRLSNWAYASSRVFESPFSWISAGRTRFERARTPEEVDEQLDAFKRWGMGRTTANFVFGDIDQFDYGPYVAAMRKASTPAVVHAEPPRLVVTSPTGGQPAQAGGPTAAVEGFATDKYAVRSVRWRDEHGGSGLATLRWDRGAGSYAGGWDWKMQWSAKDLPLRTGVNRITITVESTKGPSSSQTVEITR